ncbi:hypothetical protein ACIBCA_03500 [Kitasatospora sp. NPDC051170]|uniref:hypothetical protein n=1 Tax=Kitasatospora sp. NPDC051170 TaxID=3364056 RepID=UPI00378B8DD3
MPYPLTRVIGPLGDDTTSVAPLLCFIAGADLFAALWSRFFRGGPLEYLVHLATGLAGRRTHSNTT